MEELAAAQAAESLAFKQVDTTLESRCKDMDQVQGATMAMLEAHDRAMQAYFRLLQHKLHLPPPDRRS